MKTQTAVCLSLSMILISKMSYAECEEFKIIDHGDRVEAVCVGKPLTGAEKKELEYLKAQQKAQDKKSELKRIIDDCHRNNQIPTATKINCENLEFKQETEQMVEIGGRGNRLYGPASRVDNSAAIQGEMANQKAQMEAQQAQQQMEMQRQQAEIQRIQQQQNFNKIWNK